MKKLFATVALVAGFCTSMNAQFVQTNQHFDNQEDTTEVSTLAGLLAQKQKVTSHSNEKEHFNAVWKKTKTFDFNYTTTTMTPKFNDNAGRGVNLDEKYESDWAFTLSRTKSFNIHKPIANMLKFSIDWRGFQLNVNHFKVSKNAAGFAYDSQVETDNIGTDNEKYKYPWNLEKYEASYAMGVGPSITIAPFVPLHKDKLDFFRINAYYHFNYSAAVVYSQNDKKLDANGTNTSLASRFDKAVKLQWGHGYGTTFGFSVSYKTVGVGYEKRTVTREYQPIGAELENSKSKFEFAQSNVYLRLNF